jgi:RNA polymerase sigma-70 factor (ECF subfamily)
VYAVAYHYLGSADDAQDATQETFVHAYLHLDQLSDADKLRPWLRRIAVNAAMDILRCREHSESSLEDIDPEVMAYSDDPERAAVHTIVRQALSKLPEKMRLTVTLSYINGYSHAEVAEFLEVPVNTVRSRLRHAKRLLREDMIAMVTDVLHEDKPDPEFNRKVVDEALNRAREASQRYATGDALTYYDQALHTMDNMQATDEWSRIRMIALWERGEIVQFSNREEALKSSLQSLEIAEKLGDRKAIAEKLGWLGVYYANMHQSEKAIEYYRKALDAYRALGDPYGQGNVLRWLGTQHMDSKQLNEARQCFEQAVDMFTQAGDQSRRTACLAALDLLSVTADRFASLIRYSAFCDILERKVDGIWFADQHGFDFSHQPGGGDVQISSVFWQISTDRRMLDASVPVGEGWSGEGFSFSLQPVRVATTVRSRTESVTVPAGVFNNCLLLEKVTAESDLPDDVPEQNKQWNRTFLCGTRQAWFAPGVGLVQLHVRTGNDREALIQLREFHTEKPTNDYFPLGVGNTWSYGWANIPEEYVAVETYKTVATEDERWFLEHVQYAYKR